MNLTDAKRALVFAFKKEAESFIEKLKQAQKNKLKKYTIYTGEYLSVPTAILITGCGVSACKEATESLRTHCSNLEEVFNLGFAGSLSQLYEVGEVVQVEQVCTEQGKQLITKLVLHNNFSKVNCITTEKPVENSKNKDIISKSHGVDIVDMEAVGFCSALDGFNGAISLFKIISDSADKEFKQEIIKNSRVLSDKLEKKFKLAMQS